MSGGQYGSEYGPNLDCLNASPRANITTSLGEDSYAGYWFGVVNPSTGTIANGQVAAGTSNYQMANTKSVTHLTDCALSKKLTSHSWAIVRGLWQRSSTRSPTAFKKSTLQLGLQASREWSSSTSRLALQII